MSKSHGPLADRPNNPKVGLAIPHEDAPLHVTGQALYTDDLISRTRDLLYAWPLQAPHAHATITKLDVSPAYEVPGGGAGAHGRGRARGERRRDQARRAAVPERGDVLRARGLLRAG